MYWHKRSKAALVHILDWALNKTVSGNQEHYAKRYAEERKINIYFLQMKNAEGERHYFYVAASALLHEQFANAVEMNQIPDFSVVVADGEGEPTEEVRHKMKEYYGFDHAVYDQYILENCQQVSGQ